MRSHDLRILLERKVRKKWPRRKERDFSPYVHRPVEYCRDILRTNLTPVQAEIAEAFVKPPYKVKVRSGHGTGKSYLFAALCNWWYDTRIPSVVITTAPTLEALKAVLWAEIRLQRDDAGLSDDFIGPAAPAMRTGPDHWAKGYTASKGEAFQGRHRANMLFLFDEDEGLDPLYFQRTVGMFKPNAGHAWGTAGNPYTVTSESYRQEYKTDLDGNPAWNLFTLSAIDHPNIAAELAGLPLPVPNAVDVGQIAAAVAENCDRIDTKDRTRNDIEWPTGSGYWYRPGPLFEAGVLGRRPTMSVGSVWSESVFNDACENRLTWEKLEVPELGCDVARGGDDWTSIHARRGRCSLSHDTGNGWDTMRTCGKLIEAARNLVEGWNRDNWNRKPMSEFQIPIKVDDDGIGGAVTDRLGEQGYNVVPINAQTICDDQRRYPNRRSELWFELAKAAKYNQLDLTRIPKAMLAKLRQQAMAPLGWPDSAGRRVVEPKKDTKKRTKARSPDDMDAMNLSYARQYNSSPTTIINGEVR